MKPFRFPLQAVLTVRANQEARAKEAYVRARADVETATLVCRALDEEIQTVGAGRLSPLNAPIRSEQIQQTQTGLRLLHEKLRARQAELQKLQSLLDEKWKLYLEARIKKEAVEKIRERQWAGHKIDLSREEQKNLDEIALLNTAGSLAFKWK
jgi:flagellar protein FliJ